LPNPRKIELVEQYKEFIKDAKVIVFTDYRGLTVENMEELRRKLRKENAKYKVVKNNLFKLAIKDENFSGKLNDTLIGPVGIAISEVDPVMPVKVLHEFSKKNEKLEIKALLLEGEFYGPDKIETIAKLPTRKELLAKLLMVLNSPLTSFVNVCSGVLRKFVVVLNNIKEKKEKGK